jgi:nucleotide-binding universal stress UspA family protein
MTTGRGEKANAENGRREDSPSSAHRLLFPTDFSPRAAAAWPYAVSLARRRGAVLHVLHVVTPPVLGLSPEAAVVAAPVIDDVLAESQAILDALVEPARALKVTTRTHTRIGEPASGILACASEDDIDLIVMATTGRTGLAHVLMGSVAERVVRHAACPVLTVRHDAKAAPTHLAIDTLPHITEILVPLDGSPLAAAVLPGVISMATRHGAAVRLLRVVHAHALGVVRLAAAETRCLQAAEAYLGDIERRLAAEGLTTNAAVRYGEAVPEILDDIQVRRPNLVAMSTHGRTGLLHLVLGSVAEQVLRASPVPVLLFPARALHEALPEAAQEEPSRSTR